MKNKITFFARILAIIYIIFISIFALDSTSFLEALMHLIPSIILILILVLSFYKPRISGYLFILLSIIFTIFFQTYKNILNFTIISLILFVIGVLFSIKQKKK